VATSRSLPFAAPASAGLVCAPVVAAAALWLGLAPLPALATYGLLVLLVALAFRRQGLAVFGPANALTLLRYALALLLLLDGVAERAVSWSLFAVAAAALLLDALDGRLARRLGCASRFGARLDLEADALFLLAAGSALWLAGRAGPWVLLAGLLRPAFLLAGRMIPRLARPLPPSRRRAWVCGGAATALALALAPPLAPAAAAVLAALATWALAFSFARDLWILLRPRTP